MEEDVMNIKGSILESYADTYCFMIKQRTPDGAGGFNTSYTDGEQFLAVLRHDSTIEAQVAEKQGTASTYTFFVDKGMKFDYHEVFKRLSDGQWFRVTSASGEKETPSQSSLNMTTVMCEKWVQTND